MAASVVAPAYLLGFGDPSDQQGFGEAGDVGLR